MIVIGDEYADGFGNYELSTNRIVGHKEVSYEPELKTLAPLTTAVVVCIPPIEEGFHDDEGANGPNTTDYLYINKFL